MYVSEIVNHFQIALKGPAKGITILKGIVEGQEFIIATLSSSRLISEKLNAEHPNQRVNLKFSKDCMFVSFEVVGENEVDVIGYVTGLDATKLMSLKEAMEMSDASDDEEYECSECDGECGGHCNKHEAESDNSKETPSNEDLSRDAVSFDRPVIINSLLIFRNTNTSESTFATRIWWLEKVICLERGIVCKSPTNSHYQQERYWIVQFLMRQLVVLSPRNLELELVTFAMEWIKRFKVFVFVLDDD